MGNSDLRCGIDRPSTNPSGQTAAELIANFATGNGHDGCVSLRARLVVCLSNLMELHSTLSHHPPWRQPAVTIKRCEKIMYLMSAVSKKPMDDDDVRHLPSYAGVSTPGSYCCVPGLKSALDARPTLCDQRQLFSWSRYHASGFNVQSVPSTWYSDVVEIFFLGFRHHQINIVSNPSQFNSGRKILRRVFGFCVRTRYPGRRMLVASAAST
jgi:hypothetical protein